MKSMPRSPLFGEIQILGVVIMARHRFQRRDLAREASKADFSTHWCDRLTYRLPFATSKHCEALPSQTGRALVAKRTHGTFIGDSA